MLAFLKAFDPLEWLLIAAIAALSVLFAVEWSRVGTARIELAHAQTSLAQSKAEFADYKAAQAETTRLLQASNYRNHIAQLNQVLEAVNAAKLRESQARADLASATDERGRLLVALHRATNSHPVSSTTADAKPEPGDPIANVLEQCTAEVLDLARAADAHSNDLRTLMDAWPK